MTRKRFIKLLMSKGETLYSARAIAFLYRSAKMSYKNAYSNYLLKTSFIRACDNLAKAIQGFGLEARLSAKSIKKLAEVLKSND